MVSFEELLTRVLTGSSDEARSARKELESMWVLERRKWGGRPVFDPQWKRLLCISDRFKRIKETHSKIHALALLRLSLFSFGSEQFGPLSRVVLSALEDSSGHVRHAGVCLGRGLIFLLPMFWEEGAGYDRSLSSESREDARQKLCSFVDNLEELLLRYSRETYEHCYYVSDLPPGVYKSVQLLIADLFADQRLEKIYEEHVALKHSDAGVCGNEPGGELYEACRSAPEILIPRDEYELCELFELLVVNRHRSSFLGDSRSPNLTLNGLRFLSEQGLLNRVYRRWFHTTWGVRNWCPLFPGETPYQEFSHRYAGFTDGGALFSVCGVPDADSFRVRPFIFGKEELLAGGGPFSYALHELERGALGCVPPHYDRAFPAFVSHIRRHVSASGKSECARLSEAEYLRLFLDAAGKEVVRAMQLPLSERDFLLLARLVTERFLQLFHAPSGSDNFVDAGDFLSSLWDAVRVCEKDLLPSSEIMRYGGGGLGRINRSFSRSSFPLSLTAFHRLGEAFDREFLFPLELYFGGVEPVWTDKMNFLTDLIFTVQLSNEGRLRMDVPSPPSREQRKTSTVLKVLEEESVPDLRRLWFSPPTAFRVLDSVRGLVR